MSGPGHLEAARNQLASSPSLAQTGIGLETLDASGGTFTMPIVATSLDRHGRLHSGFLSLLIDTAAGVFANTRIGFNATVDLRIDRFDPGRECRWLHATAKCVHDTSTLAVIRVHVSDDRQRPVAEATGTFIRRRQPPPPDLSLPTSAELLSRLPSPPFAEDADFDRWLGLRTVEADHYLLPYTRRIIGNARLGQAHGGIIAGYLEAAAATSLERRLGRPIRTLDTTTTYLRFSGPGDLHAQVEVQRLGARIASMQVRAWQEESALTTAVMVGQFFVAAE